jgi:hypothetical protein
MSFDYDLTDAPDVLNFQTVPPGSYRCEIYEADNGEAKNGKPMLTLTWMILEGEYKNTAITERFVIDRAGNETALKINLGRMKRMVLATGAGLKFNVVQLPGKRAELRITTRTHEDKVYNDVADHKPYVVKRAPGPQAQAAPAERQRPLPPKREPEPPAETNPDMAAEESPAGDEDSPF